MNSIAGPVPNDIPLPRSIVLEKLGSYSGYGLLIILFVGFVYSGLRPIWQARFQANDLFLSRVAFALAPLPVGILIFALGISRPYVTFLKLKSGVFRVLAFPFDWVFIATASGCLLMYLSAPFTLIASSRSKAIVPVYYVTDRQPVSPAVSTSDGTNLEFLGTPSRPVRISYGVAEVPITWRPSVLNEIATTPLQWDRDAPIPLQVMHFADAGEFVKEISIALRRTPRHEALVFVHGFDNRFDEALDTTAKLAYDLRFDSDPVLGGVSILYSWPSAGDWHSYDSDYEHASWSADHLADLFQTLKTPQVGLEDLQLIAHSMGARVSGQALKGMEKGNSQRIFDNITLAAADVDEDTFDQFSPALKQAADRITLYVSTWDWALAISSGAHGDQRVGRFPTRREGIDVIDTLGLEASLRQFKHSYIFESQFVLDDLFALIRNGAPPNRRHSLVLTQDKCCWQFERR